MNKIPVTLSINGKYSALYINTQGVAPPGDSFDSFWFYGINLLDPTGEAVFNVVSKNNTEVPNEVTAHENDSNVLLCFMFLNLPIRFLPQGMLTGFLRAAGAGRLLAETEQIAEQSGSSVIAFPNYALAATMDTNDEPGFEIVNNFHGAVLPFQLMPIEVGGRTKYSPVRLA